MENFKFIASFENDTFYNEITAVGKDSSYDSDCKVFLFDILSVIQYYCLRKILSRYKIYFNYNFPYNLDHVKSMYFKNHQKRNITELQNFIVYFNQFLNLNVNDRGYILLDNDYFTFDKLIDKITEDILINDFDKYIDAYNIDKYTKLYVGRHRDCRRILYYFMEVFLGDEVYFSPKIDDDAQCSGFCFMVEDENNELLIRECKEHWFNNQGIIDNTMSEHIVYTSDLEITKQVLRNNQKIINNIIKNLKNETLEETSNSNKQKLMQMLMDIEVKPEVKSDVKA